MRSRYQEQGRRGRLSSPRQRSRRPGFLHSGALCTRGVASIDVAWTLGWAMSRVALSARDILWVWNRLVTRFEHRPGCLSLVKAEAEAAKAAAVSQAKAEREAVLAEAAETKKAEACPRTARSHDGRCRYFLRVVTRASDAALASFCAQESAAKAAVAQKAREAAQERVAAQVRKAEVAAEQRAQVCRPWKCLSHALTASTWLLDWVEVMWPSPRESGVQSHRRWTVGQRTRQR